MTRPTPLKAAVVILMACGSFTGQSYGAERPLTPKVLGIAVPVINSAQRDEHVGRVVAVRGVADRSKVVHLSGVEVRCPGELRGREVYAVGILSKWVVTEEDAERMSRDGRQHDGPGTQYILYFDLAGKLAEARAVKP